MGYLTDAIRSVFAHRLEQKVDSIATSVPSWDVGREQLPPFSYERAAREGYKLDEYVFACIAQRGDRGRVDMIGMATRGRRRGRGRRSDSLCAD